MYLVFSKTVFFSTDMTQSLFMRTVYTLIGVILSIALCYLFVFRKKKTSAATDRDKELKS
jgi:LPXTG-motif cell wall-anchored protein